MSRTAHSPVMMVDPQQVDETGLPWALLSRATHPDLVQRGRLLVVGPPDDPLLGRVVDLEPFGDDHLVHVEVLGSVAEVEDAIHTV